MKKIFSALMLFSFLISFSQYRFHYRYSFIPDGNKKDSIVQDIMTLDVDLSKKESNFYNDAKRYNDSILSKNGAAAVQRLFFLQHNSNLTYNITKDLLKDKMIYHTVYSGIRMKITEKSRPKWALANEEKKIRDYLCQKAETNFKGRNWIAWFTKEIPVSEGPYKFSGLPGLIVEIYDEEKNHEFSLVEVKKNKNAELHDFSKKEKEITQMQLNKLIDDGYKDPNANIKEMHISNSNYTFLLNDGNILKIRKGIKNLDSELSKQMRRMTNSIEIEKRLN
ncbi:GLPGLI family protein [Chryseobacterium gotjawalense]|uniref:GLPGLI family protein n=1 Tax=Chryseobacterium gotjawalense TaxID=3042315 RepID=A0ABY8RHM5_9FLAO|nr:GLPGLI family protein [Chryseobacterium sp. wdc7]WHF52599.1 GLPGLI family protein [Chryseobacterium sp. wdc7]